MHQQQEEYEINIEQMSGVKRSVEQLRQELKHAHDTNNDATLKYTREVDKLRQEINTIRQQLVDDKQTNDQLTRELERTSEKYENVQQNVEQKQQQVNKAHITIKAHIDMNCCSTYKDVLFLSI